MNDLHTICENAKRSQRAISKLNTEQKNDILKQMANIIDRNRAEILEKNRIDIEQNKDKLNKYMIDRLTLNEGRIDNMVDSLKQIAAQPDAVGEIVSEKTIVQGLKLTQKRVGMGVVAVIFEARPNVTSEVIGLCLKSSCSSILKCGKEAVNTCTKIVELLKGCCPFSDAFQLITERDLVKPLLSMDEHIDLIIPRGGEKLISFVNENTTIPVLHAGKGNCHIYVDSQADTSAAVKIIVNAKTQRPTVCNAAEKVVVHKSIAKELLPKLKIALDKSGVEIRGDKAVQELIGCTPAKESDWDEEYLALIIAIKVVDNISEAIEHINKHNSRHSEAIISSIRENQEKFLSEIDAACVYVNASTRFTDGYLFGMGAEIGISTQKLHARGPMGLKALTTTKYMIQGEGQIRE